MVAFKYNFKPESMHDDWLGVLHCDPAGEAPEWCLELETEASGSSRGRTPPPAPADGNERDGVALSGAVPCKRPYKDVHAFKGPQKECTDCVLVWDSEKKVRSSAFPASALVHVMM